jgi:redox-sensitive bicupin YhaK (pirin superfamily)
MITIRPANARGQTRLDWLDSKHTFSFGDYFDPAHESFRALRVINEDWIGPDSGFGMHPHRDMEIITYVVQGSLEHRDTVGTGSVIRAGDVQRMTAGTGIWHSEFNPSKVEPVHILQIWIHPEKRGLAPGYEEKSLADKDKSGRFGLVASRDGRDNSLTIHQDAELRAAVLGKGERLNYELASGRHAWVQLVRGALTLNDQRLTAGDGASVSDTTELIFKADEPSELLLFDLA